MIRTTQALAKILRCSLVAALIGVVLQAVAQESPCTISGEVLDVESGAPVEFANVYLANTTFGAAASASGIFTLRGIKPGTYQLVASRVGYEPSIFTLQCSAGRTYTHRFLLRPRVLTADEISIEALRTDDWKRNFLLFQEAFLGTDRFSSECTILNPLVVNIQRNADTQDLTATTTRPLEIVNVALGYRLEVDLQSFLSNDNTGTLSFEVYTRFMELIPRDSAQAATWQANRVEAFEGSRMHFLRAVATDSLEQEGFFVYHGTLTSLRAGRGRYAGPQLLGIVTTVTDGLKKISWDEPLRVEYRGERGTTNNVFQLVRSPTFIERSGYLHDPSAFIVHSDSPWARDRMAKMLPLNYGQ